jgi:hypothetical protein
MIYLFILRHTNSQFPRIFYTSLLLFCPLVVLYDTWFENHLHCYNWLGFSKLQDTKSFLFTWKRHVCSSLLSSGETGNYAIASVTKKLLHFLHPLACFYLLCMGLLLHGQASKSRMDLWNTLYIYSCVYIYIYIYDLKNQQDTNN